jgi:hypothetical protein
LAVRSAALLGRHGAALLGRQIQAFLDGLHRECRDRLNTALIALRTAMVKSPEFAAVLAAEEPRMLFWQLDHEPTPEPESLVAQ